MGEDGGREEGSGKEGKEQHRGDRCGSGISRQEGKADDVCGYNVCFF